MGRLVLSGDSLYPDPVITELVSHRNLELIWGDSAFVVWRDLALYHCLRVNF